MRKAITRCWKIQFSFCTFGVIRNFSDSTFKITTSLYSVITEAYFWPKRDSVEETGVPRFLVPRSFWGPALPRAPSFFGPRAF